VDHPEYALNKKENEAKTLTVGLGSFLPQIVSACIKNETKQLIYLGIPFSWLWEKCYSEKWPIIKQWLHSKVQYGCIVYKDWLLPVAYLQTKGPPPTQRRFPFGSAPLLTDTSKNYGID